MDDTKNKSKEIGKKMEAVGGKMESVGKKLTLWLTIPILGFVLLGFKGLIIGIVIAAIFG